MLRDGLKVERLACRGIAFLIPKSWEASGHGQGHAIDIPGNIPGLSFVSGKLT
jgi:hypothetical protein